MTNFGHDAGTYSMRGLSPAEKDAFPDAQCVILIDGKESDPLTRAEATKIIQEGDDSNVRQPR